MYRDKKDIEHYCDSLNKKDDKTEKKLTEKDIFKLDTKTKTKPKKKEKDKEKKKTKK